MMYEQFDKYSKTAIPIEKSCAENRYGWICPVCGKGLAPWVSACSCREMPVDNKITVSCTPGSQYEEALLNAYAKSSLEHILLDDGK